jgi:hypothetical protein
MIRDDTLVRAGTLYHPVDTLKVARKFSESFWTQVKCQSRMKVPHFAGRKFPTPEPYKTASLASDAVEPGAVFWRVLGATQSEELDPARSIGHAKSVRLKQKNL